MEADVRVLRKDSGFDPGCVKTLRGIIAPGILGPMVMRRAKKRKNLSSARHYDQIRFRFYTTKTHFGHRRDRNPAVQRSLTVTGVCYPVVKRLRRGRRHETSPP